MATPTSAICGGCDFAPYPFVVSQQYQYNPLFEGGVVTGVPLAETGQYGLRFNFRLPNGCAVVGNSLTSLISVTVENVLGTVTYTATNSDGAGTPAADPAGLYTSASTTKVGSILSRSGYFAGNILFPAAAGILDGAYVFLDYLDTCGTARRLQVARLYAANPCISGFVAITQTLTSYYSQVCAADLCTDLPAIYINGQLVGSFNKDGALTLDRTTDPAYAGLIGYFEKSISGNGWCCDGNSLYTVRVYVPQGLAATDVVTYVNGTERTVLSDGSPRCTYTYDFTGAGATSQIRVTELLVDGVGAIGTGNAGYTAVAGTLAQQLTSLATLLSTAGTGLGLGTWVATATSLALQTQRVLGSLTGLNGAATPAALTLAPAVSGCI